MKQVFFVRGNSSNGEQCGKDDYYCWNDGIIRSLNSRLVAMTTVVELIWKVISESFDK